ncbi:MAG: GDSL-type esterase/lipase family protein [Tannerella sp.]|jgi:hypothetical protein|nr:GDSL-type esterase/lipase family protein [Tannerella sp.]
MTKLKVRSIDFSWIVAAVMITVAIGGNVFFTAEAAADVDEALEIERIPRNPLVDSITVRLDFAVDTLCLIADPANSLDAFLAELEKLMSGEDTVVNIVHLGDSHTQAGFYTGQIMRTLQEVFGNAGRGWISPLKLAKINEPKDYFITSNVNNWIAGRCIQAELKCPIGPGAVGISSESDNIDFTIRIAPVNGVGYAFNQAVMYRDSNAVPMLPKATDTTATFVCWGDNSSAADIATDTFRLANETDELTLQSVKRFGTAKSVNCYFGFSLTNGNPGILYHAVGQNGAMFSHYLRPDYFSRLALLKPSLLVVSLGTNESFAGARFRAELFESQVDSLVKLVRAAMPETAILLTTPAESFRRINKRYERNKVIGQISSILCKYAEKEQLACFDVYTATGGEQSCLNWEKAGLLGRDHVHYNAEGYAKQGKMLSKALIRMMLNRENELASDE